MFFISTISNFIIIVIVILIVSLLLPIAIPRGPRVPQMTVQEQKERFDFLSAAFALTPEGQARDHAYRASMKLKQLEAIADFTDDHGAEV